MGEDEINYEEQRVLLEEERIADIEFKAYMEGCKDERKRIMDIVDNADDIAQAIYLLGQYIIQQELQEDN